MFREYNIYIHHALIKHLLFVNQNIFIMLHLEKTY